VPIHTVVVAERWLACVVPAHTYVQVQRGCVLNAKAQGCTPGVDTCNPCKPAEVLISQDGLPQCVNKTTTCSLNVMGFQVRRRAPTCTLHTDQQP
jgi:hypothetical protein